MTREETTEDDETRYPVTPLSYNPNSVWYKNDVTSQ